MALQVSIVSREKEHWKGAAKYLRVPTITGSLGILPGRQPLLAALQPGTVVIKPENGTDYHFHVETGFISLDSDVATLVIDNGSPETAE